MSKELRRHLTLCFAFSVLTVAYGITQQGLLFWAAIAVLPLIAVNYWRAYIRRG